MDPRRILVVEDEKNIRDLVCLHLEIEGYECVPVADGSEGMAVAGAESFDLDPCAAPAPQPWPTARTMFTEAMGDGLSIDWDGRVWLNLCRSVADKERPSAVRPPLEGIG